jgi:selenocysteine-specific elongation factor
MKNLILGTAGHIDHGKTSLVKALTGIDTDRLKEEKERGITIELGFAHLELPGGIVLGIVDVPGHERFVRTMAAGAGGMDMVVLVIAADEGIMPQTREHLDICRLLGVKRGLVALNKCDMVDTDWQDLVVEEVRDYLSGTFLEGAPIVPVSSRTMEGIEELKSALASLAAEVEEKTSEGPFRLPVDRVFTVPGFGTVVTGTLLSGSVKTGDEVEILPTGTESRVRTLQTHGKSEDHASAGQRVAINLQGVEHASVSRGDVVVPRNLYRTTRVIDARLTCIDSASREMKHRSVLRLHSATYEVPAQLIILEGDSVAPGETRMVQLRLKSPALLLPGDFFILRSYSPPVTVGGGMVLDPAPPRRRRRSAEALELLNTLQDGEDSEKVRLMVRESLLTGISIDEISIRSGLNTKLLEATITGLLSRGLIVQAVRTPRVFLSSEAFENLKSSLMGALESYLRDNPLKEGIGKEELRTRLPKRSDHRFFGPVLTSLEKEGKVTVERELVKMQGYKTSAGGDRSVIHKRIESALNGGGYEPPSVRELCDSLRLGEKEILDHLNLLARENLAVKIRSDLFYSPSALSEIREKLVSRLKEKGEINPSEFRELTGLSRKFMIPLLEYFDREKVTIRVGDKRVPRKV